jgi:low molecular weight protein-tyrosine phosphatase
MSADTAFQLVVLCTGNRFRSPLAEVLLRDLTEGLPVDVSSAGTLSLGEVPALPEAIEAATAMGLDLNPHRFRHFRNAALADADLVLGFERAHVATAVVDGAAKPERTFTVPELVELLRQVEPRAHDPIDRAREAIALAHGARSARPPLLDLSELGDPYGRSQRVYRETAERVETLCEELAARLFRAPPRRHPDADEGWLKRIVSR